MTDRPPFGAIFNFNDVASYQKGLDGLAQNMKSTEGQTFSYLPGTDYARITINIFNTDFNNQTETAAVFPIDISNIKHAFGV
jgi:hypothetical protein